MTMLQAWPGIMTGWKPVVSCLPRSIPKNATESTVACFVEWMTASMHCPGQWPRNDVDDQHWPNLDLVVVEALEGSGMGIGCPVSNPHGERVWGEVLFFNWKWHVLVHFGINLSNSVCSIRGTFPQCPLRLRQWQPHTHMANFDCTTCHCKSAWRTVQPAGQPLPDHVIADCFRTT